MSTDRYSQSRISQEEILALALERLAAGESSASILADAGADAEWLAPMLALASAVRDLRQAMPVPPAQASLARFLAHAERVAPRRASQPMSRRWWDRLRLPGLMVPRLVATAFSVLLTIFGLTVGFALFLGAPATVAAQDILPGQWAYPIKRLGEELYLRLPQSAESRSLRVAEYEGRRREEMRALLERGLEACVTFRGDVEVLDVTQVVVDGIAMQITGETQIEGPLAAGAQAQVEACTLSSGALVARHILVQQPAPPIEVPSPTPAVTETATPQPTVAVTRTPMPMPTPTKLIEATATLGPEPSVTIEPTRTPILSPTATPTSQTASPTPRPIATQETPEPRDEAGNGNDNGNDQANDNEGDDNTNDGDDDARDSDNNNAGDDDNGDQDNNDSSDDDDVNADDSDGDVDHSGADESGSDRGRR